MDISRRNFLKAAVVTAAASAIPFTQNEPSNTVLWGDKTLNAGNALAKVNDRRVLNLIIQDIERVYADFEGQFTVEDTRHSMRDRISSAMRQYKDQRAVYDYIVILDERNNPPEVADDNDVITTVYVKLLGQPISVCLNFSYGNNSAFFSRYTGLTRDAS